MGLVIKDLKVSLMKSEILHGISLDVKDGELVSLLGASGCGKSTLLKAIAGLTETDGGIIEIDGSVVNETAPEKRGSVIVFQDLRLFPHMDVGNNIAFPMRLRKMSVRDIENKVKSLLNDVHLDGFERRQISEISGGQMQRVALARAIAAQPKLLLLDEPFSGLDEELRIEMEKLVAGLHKKMEITTVLVTHDKREALYMSDRVALMDCGNILQYDTPHNIYYNPNSKKTAEYFGRVNYIKGNIKSGIFTSNSGIWKTKPGDISDDTIEDGEYEALVRPHNIGIIKDGGRYVVKSISFMGEFEEISIDTGDKTVFIIATGGYCLSNSISIGNYAGISIEAGMVKFLKVDILK